MISCDITDEFTRAASKLELGQLVRHKCFSLFDAVGALEIMDSKMDSGYLGGGENHAQALEDDYDVMRELRPEEVLGIMDQLLCHEMAWHMGHPLSQTLFTSIYLDRLLWPSPVSFDDARFGRDQKPDARDVERDRPWAHLVLRVYCLALVKACDLVLARVTSECYYEEEDFVTLLFNRSLLSVFDLDHFYPVLDRAVTWLSEQEGKIDVALQQALVDRLEFRRNFLVALGQDVVVMKEPFKACLAHVLRIEKSIPLGEPVPDAFSLKIQRRLASTMPPRPMVNISAAAAMDHLRRFCQDAIDTQEILDYNGPYNLRVSVQALMSRRPQPSVYIRALLQTFIASDRKVLGRVAVQQCLYDDLAELVLPYSPLLQGSMDDVEAPSDPRFQMARHMEGFVRRASQPFVDGFRTACLNRCRVRRMLCHTIIEWDNLQVEAEELDAHLRTLTLEAPLMTPGGPPTYSYPLSSWAYHEKLRQLRLIIQLGFELTIYSPEEFPGMFWYLSHLCSTHIAHLDRIRTFVTAASTQPQPKSKHRSGERKRAFKRTLDRLDRHTTHLVAIEALALALHALYVLLDRHGLLPRTRSCHAYSNARLRYELRMKPFLPILLPELVPFDIYEREAALHGDSDAVVLSRALTSVGEARKAWEGVLSHGAFLPPSSPSRREAAPPSTVDRSATEEDWLRDVKDSLRACIGASIAIGTVRQALSMQAGTRPSSDSAVGADGGDGDGEGDGRDRGRVVPFRVEIPEVGRKGRWHACWAVPQVSEVPAV
ncbi:Mak10 subunit, NatC N(alpha)-terminal acetyltransferase domain containing protein [Elaphomyces granulatus]